MNKLLTLLIVTFLGTVLPAQGIEFFHGTYEEAFAKAQKEDKLVFVDAFAKWCGPCKRMAKNVFTQKSVGDFFNENFINLKMDMEETEGRKFGKTYPVSAYPTLMFINGDGKLVKKVKGAQQAPNLISLGKLALKSNDQSGKYAALYDEGNRDYDVVFKYVKALNSAGKPSLKIANDYINSAPSISKEELALFTYEAISEADSRIFDLMLEHKEIILSQVDKEKFKAKVISACKATVNKAIEYDMVSLKEETNEKCIKALGKKDAKLENLKLDMDYYSQLSDVKSYLKATDEILKKYGKKDLSLYRTVVEDINKKFKKDAEAIKKGIKYSKDLFKKEDNADNAVLYVRMLIEGKDYDKGIEVIDIALEKQGEKGSDVPKLKSIKKYVESLKADSNS